MGRVHLLIMRIPHNTLVVILLVFTFLGCTHQLDTPLKEVRYELFSLSGTDYTWKEVTYPHDNEVVIINSFDELKNYITTSRNNHQSLPIDFSKHSLLLARGVEPYNIRATIEYLRQLQSHDYVLHIKLASNIATVITNWQVALITPKLEYGDKVILYVEKDVNNPTMP